MIYVDPRKNKDGSITWRITYNDETGKRCRMSPKLHPKFLTRAEAEQWAKSQEAYQNASRARMQRKNEWRSQFYDFVKLEKDFVNWHKAEAPNSYKNSRYYMIYVLEFFLNVKQQGNVNLWHLFHQEFRDWLTREARGTRKINQDKAIAYSTANGCIKTLNNFMRFLVAYNLMDKDSNVTCECFPQHLVGKRGWEDVITKEEFVVIHKQLVMLDQDVADFFYVDYWTGMRFAELLGLPMAFVYGGQLDGPIGEELKKHNVPCFGYIVLESQLKEDFQKRLPDNSFARKPLKTRKKISPENSRTIPVMDKECWNIIARRYKIQKAKLDQSEFGLDKMNYLIFDGMNMSHANRTLKRAYERVAMRAKSFHCCRHSRATYLVGETRSYFLGRSIIGHRSDAFDGYVHTFAMVALKAKQSSQDIDEI